MHLKFPWILSRKRLIAAVILDGILFAFLYHGLYEWRFGVWPQFSFPLATLLSIWSLSSYVIGRYANGTERLHGLSTWNIVLKQLASSALVLFLTIGITIVHSWILSPQPVHASSSSFLILFLVSLAALSPILQLALLRFFALNDLKNDYVWTYVGSICGFQQLQEMLKWSRLQVAIEHVKPDELSQVSSSQYIVDHFHAQPSSVLQSLCRSQQKGATVLSRLSWCEMVLQRFPAELLSAEDLLDGCFSMPNGTLQRRLKRVGDITVALLLLVITFPLTLISGFFIKIGDGGPIFYSQLRVGLDGNTYRIWKLRTMRIDAENHGAQWSTNADPRITRFGSILRRTRLDELPQLWSVLTGSMSLIGPRPERPEFDVQLSKHIPYYQLRYLIRPGLSGWAQVNYSYGASVEDSAIKLSYDLFYLKNFSFFLDLLILFKTIRLVFTAQGALPQPPANSNFS